MSNNLGSTLFKKYEKFTLTELISLKQELQASSENSPSDLTNLELAVIDQSMEAIADEGEIEACEAMWRCLPTRVLAKMVVDTGDRLQNIESIEFINTTRELVTRFEDRKHLLRLELHVLKMLLSRYQ